VCHHIIFYSIHVCHNDTSNSIHVCLLAHDGVEALGGDAAILVAEGAVAGEVLKIRRRDVDPGVEVLRVCA
jgi:hypothetical protein